MKFREALVQYKELHNLLSEVTSKLSKANIAGEWDEAKIYHKQIKELYKEIENFENKNVIEGDI